MVAVQYSIEPGFVNMIRVELHIPGSYGNFNKLPADMPTFNVIRRQYALPRMHAIHRLCIIEIIWLL